MKVFISYHRADTKYRHRIEAILQESCIPYYAVPEDTIFDGMHNQAIKDQIVNKIYDCDVLICIVGKETYTRGHVDWELYTALKGQVGKRKGAVAILVESRRDSKYNIDYNTFPNRLQDNEDYIVIEQYASIADKLLKAIDEAEENRNDRRLQVNNQRPPMQLRAKYYYDNYIQE